MTSGKRGGVQDREESNIQQYSGTNGMLGIMHSCAETASYQIWLKNRMNGGRPGHKRSKSDDIGYQIRWVSHLWKQTKRSRTNKYVFSIFNLFLNRSDLCTTFWKCVHLISYRLEPVEEFSLEPTWA